MMFNPLDVGIVLHVSGLGVTETFLLQQTKDLVWE
jgi:hypothetical protein